MDTGRPVWCTCVCLPQGRGHVRSPEWRAPDVPDAFCVWRLVLGSHIPVTSSVCWRARLNSEEVFACWSFLHWTLVDMRGWGVLMLLSNCVIMFPIVAARGSQNPRIFLTYFLNWFHYRVFKPRRVTSWVSCHINGRLVDRKECRLLGCDAVWLLSDPMFRRNASPTSSSRWKESAS
jgi:hypothetical protein